MIRVRRLRLVGRVKNYDVSFLDEHGAVRPLSIISGEISTGKSSILDFIDYCLGAAKHPAQIEVVRQALTAQLEIELDGRQVTIERPLFTSEQWVLLHECRIDELAGAHASRRVALNPATDSTSLNWSLLQASGLEGVVLKQAPTKKESATNYLSFRDVMDLAYLDASRLAPGKLLHEDVFMKRLKLQQLVDVVFDVHDQALAVMGDRIRRLQEERSAHQREIKALEGFLAEQETPDRATLDEQRQQVRREGRDATARLRALDANIASETASASAVRETYGAAQLRVRRAASRLRDRDALLQRLLPLRGQYAEDERKLVFFAEARLLFDPLAVQACPSCLQKLPEPPTVHDGTCTLCDQAIERSSERPIDVDAERRTIARRLGALDRYIGDVEEERRRAEQEMRDATDAETEARAELDNDLGTRLAPFVADRDRLVRRVEVLRARRAEIASQLRQHDAVDRRVGELVQLESRLSELRAEHDGLKRNQPEKRLVVADLSGTFGALLGTFGFPKVSDPELPSLSETYHPKVRGTPYEELRSRGATTLVALAWQLNIFERAIEWGRPHPGFLMIDSPQNGLKPAEGETPVDEFHQAEIAERLWLHIRNWADAHPNAQLIVVDNLPPALVDQHVVVRYSGRAESPPYGFIDNEDAVSG